MDTRAIGDTFDSLNSMIAFALCLVVGWLICCALLSLISGWASLARTFPGGKSSTGSRVAGQVLAIGAIPEFCITSLYASHRGLSMSSGLLFRFTRPAVLVPWPQVRYLSEGRALGWHSYLLDLGGVTTVRLDRVAYHIVRPFMDAVFSDPFHGSGGRDDSAR